jgi:DUF4097 and DUF4098 domain-containing protein YvlB
MSARKIGFLILLLAFGAAVETAWQVRGDVRLGPEGCRVIRGRFYGPSYAFEEQAERPLAAGEAPRLDVDNAFGGVTVRAGTEGVVKAKLRKVVFLPTEEKARAFADRVELRLSVEGARARVGTNRDEIARGEDVGLETHLEIEAPATTTLTLRNEHGRVDLSGLAGADVTSSFEGVTVDRLSGGLKLDARHGEVRASGIGGTLELKARHGNVEVSDVAGASRLDVQHGDLAARKTGALDVEIQHGALEAEGVDGRLAVRGAHARVRASDVTGGAEVETSYEGIHLARVGGDVRATAQHGEVAAEDVAGSLVAETTHGDVRLERVDGKVEAVADHGGVEARGLARGAKVRTKAGDATLEGFAGPVEVEVERASARLAPRAALAATVTASATQGEVRLDVPEGSRFDLEAESKRGDLSAEVPGLVPSETTGRPGHGRRLTGKLAGGGPAVRLRADGDVTLEPTSAGPVADRPVAKPAVAASPDAPKPPAEAPAPAAAPAKAATPKPPPSEAAPAAPPPAPEAPAPAPERP